MTEPTEDTAAAAPPTTETPETEPTETEPTETEPTETEPTETAEPTAPPPPHVITDADFQALTKARRYAAALEREYEDLKKETSEAKKTWEAAQSSFERLFDRVMSGEPPEPRLPFDGVHQSDIQQLAPHEQPAVVQMVARLRDVAGIELTAEQVAGWTDEQAAEAEEWLNRLGMVARGLEADETSDAVATETPAFIMALFAPPEDTPATDVESSRDDADEEP